MSKISDLKRALGSGARTNKFEVQFQAIPGVDIFKEIGSLLAKSTAFPGKNIPMVEAFLRGRKTLLQGMTDYGNTFEVTFYETSDHRVRTIFLLWMRLMDDDVLDMHNYTYVSTATIKQLQNDGSTNHFGGAYTLLNMWPQAVGEMSMDASEVNTVGTFTVTFAFDSAVPVAL